MAAKQEETLSMDSRSELERLRVNHQVFKGAAKGELVFAGVDWSGEGKRVLDVAGADGCFTDDLQQNFLSRSGGTLSIVVTDIVPEYFPTHHPDNVEFIRHDTSEPWPSEWSDRFDLIHQRLGFGTIAHRGDEVVKEFFRMTKPGGWIQLSEMDLAGPPDAGPANRNFCTLLRAVFAHHGQDPLYATQSMRRWVEDAGFVNVQEMRLDCGLGKLQPDPALKEASVQANLVAMDGLAKSAKAFDPMPEALAKIDLDALADQFAREGQDDGTITPMIYVWAQRPDAQQST